MQILFDERFSKLIQQELNFDEEVMMQMRRDYMDMFIKIRFNETLVFIEENKLAEVSEEMEGLADTTLSEDEQVSNLDKFYVLINKTIDKYPELQKRIESKLSKFNQEMSEALFEKLSDEAMIKISTFLVEDAKNSKELSDKFPEVPRFPRALNSPQ